MGLTKENVLIAPESIEDFDGLIGNGTGYVDTESENAKISFSRLKELASLELPNREIKRNLLQIRWRMEDYLRDEIYIGTNDIPSMLAECIKAAGVRHKDFAAYTDIKPSNLSAMLKGRRSVSPIFAMKLEQIFGISATLWLSVQSKNELERLRQKRQDFSPTLNFEEILAKVGEAKPLPPTKSKKHEPTRKAAGQ
jgi:addiction module HigA family antidote